MKNLGWFLTVFVMLSAPAFAEDRYLTLFGGAQFPGKITVSGTGSGVGQIIADPLNVGVFGIRYSKVKVFGHEETFAYTPKFLDGNSKSIILNSNFIAQIPTPMLQPYATAGLGAFFTWGSGVSDLGNKMAFNYGGGLKITPGGPVGIRFEGRGYAVLDSFDQTLNIGEVSVGVLFRF
jgi:hypothetical protein